MDALSSYEEIAMKKYLLPVLSLLLAGAGAHVAQGNPQGTGEYTFRAINVSDGLSDSEIRSINYAPNGLVCIRTSRSLNIYNGASFTQYYYNYEAVPYNENTGVQQDYFDGEGRMWLKETDKLWVFDFESGEFIYDIAPLLAWRGIEISVKSLFVDESGGYWIVDPEGRLYLNDAVAGGLWTVDDNTEISADGRAMPVEITDSGDLCWILYDNHILKCWDRSSRSFTHRESALVAQVTSLPWASTPRKVEVAPEGDLWILYSQALYRYDTTTHTVQTQGDS